MRTKRHNFAFTLIEMMTVISIIVLVLGLAVPVVHSLEGNRSLEAGYNRISAALGHARQIAIYNHAPAGVVFYPDPFTGQQDIGYVMQEKNIANDANLGPEDDRYFDLIPLEEIITLPAGLGIQVVRGSDQLPAPGAAVPFNGDKYLRAGIVLFDESGQLTTSTQYWIRGVSKLGVLLNLLQPTVAASQLSGLMPPYNTPALPTGLTINLTAYPNAGPVNWQEAILYAHSTICLYDSVAYGSQVNATDGKSFSDVDSITSGSPNNVFDSYTYSSYFGLPTAPKTVNPNQPAASDKLAEQNWLDQNGEMLVVKPNDGSLLRNK
jgi:prepilin-type N-terminal cleavage/methylation domain-containing protein